MITFGYLWGGDRGGTTLLFYVCFNKLIVHTGPGFALKNYHYAVISEDLPDNANDIDLFSGDCDFIELRDIPCTKRLLHFARLSQVNWRNEESS